MASFNFPPESLYRAWTAPQGVFLVLLLVGGNVVEDALAQLTGGPFAAVPFSFGWLAYIFSALAAISHGHLMPVSRDPPCKVIDVDTGTIVENRSWVIGRIVKDFESWMHPEAVKMVKHLKEQKEILGRFRLPPLDDGEPGTSSGRIGLCISLYEANYSVQPGEMRRDLPFYSGFLCVIIQLGISSIPLAINGDWSVFLLTSIGTILAFVTAALPQWNREKTTCRHQTQRSFVLAKEGAQHAIVVFKNGYGQDLQDLAEATVFPVPWSTRLAILILSVLWMGFLVTASSETTGTWYLIAVGAAGEVNNLYVGNATRHPSAFGIHLVFGEVIGRGSALETLYQTERRFPRLGRSMLPVLCPGPLKPNDDQRWQRLEESVNVLSESGRTEAPPGGAMDAASSSSVHEV